LRPRKNAIGADIRHQAHIAFLYPRKPFYRGSIEPNPLLNRNFQAIDWNVYTLNNASYICELQTDELHIIFVCTLYDFFGHVTPPDGHALTG
jgi:hypothetical protein